MPPLRKPEFGSPKKLLLLTVNVSPIFEMLPPYLAVKVQWRTMAVPAFLNKASECLWRVNRLLVIGLGVLLLMIILLTGTAVLAAIYGLRAVQARS